jgi:hypothetical protein
MQCAQNLRNPARARRAGARRWIFYTRKLGEILFSMIFLASGKNAGCHQKCRIPDRMIF